MYNCCFVLKQKTVYEMRISDWSSDVCSSDLDAVHEEAAVVVGAGDALAVDQYLRIAGRKAAEPCAVAFDDVRQEGHRRHALQGVARGQGLEPLKKFAVVGEDGLGLFGAVAEADADEDDDVLARSDRTVAATLFGDGKRRLPRG